MLVGGRDGPRRQRDRPRRRATDSRSSPRREAALGQGRALGHLHAPAGAGDRAEGVRAGRPRLRHQAGVGRRPRRQAEGAPRAARERKSARGVSGSLREMGLPDMVQVLFHGRKSGNLKIRARDGAGEIHFAEGNVVDAAVARPSRRGGVLRDAQAARRRLRARPGVQGRRRASSTSRARRCSSRACAAWTRACGSRLLLRLHELDVPVDGRRRPTRRTAGTGFLEGVTTQRPAGVAVVRRRDGDRT